MSLIVATPLCAKFGRLAVLMAMCFAASVATAQVLTGGPEHSSPAEQPTSTPISQFLDSQGQLSIPEGYTGSLDPSGMRLISKPGEPPRFAKNTVDDPDRWDDQFGLAIGCDERVNTIAVTTDSKLLIGGKFSVCGNVEVNRVALWDPQAGTFSPLGLGIGRIDADEDPDNDDKVYAAVVTSRGYYVGGEFSVAGGVSTFGVAYYDGSDWSALGTGVADTVFTLAVSASEDDIYVGGEFSEAGGVSAANVARFNVSSQTWFQLGGAMGTDGVNGSVRALAVTGSEIYVGGKFGQAGNVSANNVARYNGTDWSSLGSGVQDSGGGANNRLVSALLTTSTGVYVGGKFDSAGGAPVSNVAHFNTDTQVWSALGGGVNNEVRAFAVLGSDLYVGGDFDQADGTSANSVARFDGASWSTLGSGAANGVNQKVRVLATIGTDIYAGGVFYQAGGSVAFNLARFNSAQVWTTVGSGPGNGLGGSLVFALAVSGANVYICGLFDQAGGIKANNVAGFDTQTQTWFSLGTDPEVGVPVPGTGNGVDRPAFAIAVAGSVVYVGGSFTEAGGLDANRVAAFDTLTQTWNSLGVGAANGVNNQVRTLAAAGSDLYVGGVFSRAGGAPAARVARFDGASWRPLGGGVSGIVRAITIDGSRVYVGGDFSFVGAPGGGIANGVAVWNGSAWAGLGGGVDATGAPPVTGENGLIYDIAILGTDVYVGGNFTAAGLGAGRVSANSVAVWNGSAWASLGQSPAGGGVNSRVRGLEPIGTDLYVLGDFTEAGGIVANRVARFDTLQQNWSELGGGLNEPAFQSATLGMEIYFGGPFTSADGNRSLRIARYDARRESTIGLTATPLNGSNQATANTSLTFTANVSSNGFPSQLGTVSFFNTDLNAPIPGCSSVALIGGVDTRTATCEIGTLRVGSYLIGARYSGDAVNFPGTTGPGELAPLEVISPALEIAPATLPTATAGVSFNQVIALVAGSGASAPISYAITAGGLPSGLNFISATGQITGSPIFAGEFGFTVTATDTSTTSASGGPFSVSQGYVLSVARQLTQISIDSISPTPSMVNEEYSVAVTVSGQTANLPTGLISCSDGDVSSSPVALVSGSATCQLTSVSAGTKTITVTYTDVQNIYQPSMQTQAHEVLPAVANGIIKVGKRIAVPGETTVIPISFAGDGDTRVIDALIDFNPGNLDQLALLSVQGASGGTCTEASGIVRMVRSAVSALPNADTRYCEVTATVLPTVTTGSAINLDFAEDASCVDLSGIARQCMTIPGQVAVAALDPFPEDGNTIVIAGYADMVEQSRTVRVENRGNLTHTADCSIIQSGTSLSIEPSGVFPIEVGATGTAVLSCTLPAAGNDIIATLECDTNDPIRPLLRYPVVCTTVPDGTPLPNEQLLDIERRAGELIGSSVDRQPSLNTVVTALGAPLGGADGNGRVLLFADADSPQSRGLSKAVAILRTPPRVGKGMALSQRLGAAVALRTDGSQIAVGAPGAGPEGLGAGQVWVFDRPANGWGEFDSHLATPTVFDAPTLPGGSTLEFGAALAYTAHGDLIVGAPGSATTVSGAGAVFVYPWDGTALGLPSSLTTGGNAFANGNFGSAVAALDELIVVGAPGEFTDGVKSGAAYTIAFLAGKPGAPVRIALAEPLAANARFGSAVAMTADLLAIGAPGADLAIAFRTQSPGAAWTETERLIPDASGGGDQLMGSAIAINSSIAINGEIRPPPDPNNEAKGSIAINGDVLVVGAPSANTPVLSDVGRVYVYSVGSVPSDQGNLLPIATLENAGGKLGDEFGRAVTVNVGAAVVGVPRADLELIDPDATTSTIILDDVGRGATFRGSAFVFDPVFADDFE